MEKLAEAGAAEDVQAEPSWINLLDLDGRFVRAGSGFSEALGYTAAELAGFLLHTLVHEDSRDRMIAEFSRLAGQAPDAPAILVHQMYRREGGTLLLESVLRTIAAEVPGRYRVLMSCRIKADRRRSDASLQQHVAQLRQLTLQLEHQKQALDSHSIVSIADASGVIAYVNDMFCAASGYAREELVGKSHRILKSGSQPDCFYRELWQSITTGRVWRGEMMNRRKDGGHFWVETTIVPILDDRGVPAQYVSVSTDISLVKDKEKSLRASEERLHMCQEMARIGMFDRDIATDRVIWTGRYAEMLGLSSDSGELPRDEVLRVAHPDDLSGLQEANRRSIEEGVPFDHEFRVVLPDGEVRWIQVRANVIRDGDGRPLRMLGVMSDITDERRLRKDLEEAKHQAEMASRAKSDFLASMSHELRTPLNAILGFAQVLEAGQGGMTNDDQLPMLERIRHAGWHLLDLINEILDLARIESGKVELNPEPLNLAGLLDEQIMLVEPLAERHRVRIVRNVGADERHCVVQGDARRLRQVLLNLLTNAVKYNREGGEVRLEIDGSRCREGWLMLHVSDTGFGIPAQRLSEMFEPFNRLGRENGRIEGTGVGLAICRRLVEMMDGRIEVASVDGTGSTFTLFLRLTSGLLSLDVPNICGSRGRPIGRTVFSRSDARVLYVEDDCDNAAVVQQLLQILDGPQLDIAATCSEALEMASVHQYDVLLIDLDLPDGNGNDLLRRMREHAGLAAAPAIVLSADAMPASQEAALVAGFMSYLTKPLNLDLLVSTLNEALARVPEKARAA